MHKTFLLLAMGGLAAAMLATEARAGDTLAAETCLRTKVWDGYTEGWGIRTMTSTTLQQGATKNYLVTLYKGNEYLIRTCGDDVVKNLDVYLYDINGNVVKHDEDTGKEPSFQYKPEATATYYIVLHAKELADPKKEAGVAMAVTYK